MKTNNAPAITEFWFDIDGEHRRIYAIRKNEADKSLFYMDRSEVLEFKSRFNPLPATLTPADIQSISRMKAKGNYLILTHDGGSYAAYLLRRKYKDTERSLIPPESEESEPAKTAAALTSAIVRREIAPIVAPIAALTRKLDDVAPQVAADQRKAQLAWIQKTGGCSDVEKKAALLRTDGMTLSEIAKRLPHKNGKPMTRQGVRQALKRFERKTRNPKLFSKGTYRQNVKIEAEAKESGEDGNEDTDS